jgi:hypothetical protein
MREREGERGKKREREIGKKERKGREIERQRESNLS